MGLRRRLGRLLRARARRLRGPDDPIAMLELAYSRQLATADAIRQGIAGLVTARTRLRLQRRSLERERGGLEESARGHLRGGREDLAAAALTQAELLRGQVEILAGQERRLGADHDALDAAGRRHQAGLALLRTQKEALGAQHAADRARLGAAEALAGLGADDTAVRVLLDRARERMLAVAARADALAELTRRPALTDTSGLEAELATAAVAGGVQRRLAALRGELGLPPG
ncbi:MAG TPA: PspA/IM30 family protein [Candidatus Dormibacteraeota bacterium]